jgi:hypothetical protein
VLESAAPCLAFTCPTRCEVFIFSCEVDRVCGSTRCGKNIFSFNACESEAEGVTVSGALVVMEDRAPLTVGDETSLTLGTPCEMTNDELAGIVVQAFAKIRDYLPYIVELKSRFNEGDRDSENHLLTPIKGCYSWKEFCQSILNRAPRTVWDACREKKPKLEAHTVTEAEFAEYEQENQGIRKLTEKLLADGLPQSDVVSALVNMEHPQEMAEAAVRVVTGQPLNSTPPNVFPLDVAFTALSPLLGESAGCILNALPTALDWVKKNEPLTAYQIDTLSAIVTALGQISKFTSDYHDKLEKVLGSVRDEVVA